MLVHVNYIIFIYLLKLMVTDCKVLAKFDLVSLKLNKIFIVHDIKSCVDDAMMTMNLTVKDLVKNLTFKL